MASVGHLIACSTCSPTHECLSERQEIKEAGAIGCQICIVFVKHLLCVQALDLLDETMKLSK